LSPDEVMGGGVWAKEIRQAHDRTSEKPNVRKGINWSRSECCPLNGEPLFGIGSHPANAVYCVPRMRRMSRIQIRGEWGVRL
jgi:hypothetical protein